MFVYVSMLAFALFVYMVMLSLLAPSVKADPLADCRNLAGQMEANTANNSMASVAVTLSFKAEVESLEKQLAAVTKERDDLRLQLKGAKPDG